MDRTKYLFMNINLNQKLTGIERASLSRAKLFYHHLQIIPTIVTAQYNHKSLRFTEELRQSGVLHPQIPVLNMYEYFQDTLSTIPAKKTKTNPNWIYKQVADRPDYRIYNEGKMLMYQKRHADGTLDYVNIFANGKKMSREKYDYHGRLSVRQMLEPESQRVQNETFYRVDGTICMVKYFRFVKDKTVLQAIYLYNEAEQLIEVFANEAELIAYWLLEILDLDTSYCCIVDKNRVYYQQLMAHQLPNVKIVTCIHALHTKAIDVEKSVINSNYAAIFENDQQPDGVVVLTNKQKQDIEKRFGDTSHYHVIPHAINEMPQEVAWNKRNPYKVVALARYSAEKQLDQMIQIFSRVVAAVPEATLEIYGYGAEKIKLKHLIRKLEMEEHIFLKDYVANIAEVYESSVLSLLTSRTEAFSLVTMESLAHGCPVITYDINYGPADMVADGKNGYLIPLGDETLFAEKIIASLKDTDKLQAMSEAAYELSTSYSAAHIADKWKKLLDHI